jgi:hypothetical protein
MKEKLPNFDSEAHIPASLRKLMEAKENGMLKEYFLKRFRHLKDDFRDDLPDTDVRLLTTLDDKGHTVGDNYKCRGNYLWILKLALESIKKNGVITDPALTQKIDTFLNYDFNSMHGRFTTQEEINMMNNILDEIIEILEK